MPTIVVRHKVENFDTWLKGHQDRVKIFSKFCPGFNTFQDTNDPNSVVMVCEVNDVEALQKVMSDPELMKMAHEKHTVIDPITISMPVAI
ncbi:MAG: hypothetical protein EPN37_08555 [Chitinophagaceae bacterium]|jgi:hypothetical protein|nr:MAG: hypothetical protein EPN37_08555 [Chitinophagaceae bacterium]